MVKAMERLYYEENRANESLEELVKEMDRLYQMKIKEHRTGNPAAFIKSMYRPEPPKTYKVSRRTCELALPKWHHTNISDVKSLNFTKRLIKNFDVKLPPKNKEEPKPTILKQIESGRNRTNNARNFGKSTIRGPRLVVFPPLPTINKPPCPKRIAELAEPRYNSMEERKREIAEQDKIYSVSEATLKAIPSERIISLAKHRDKVYPQTRKQSRKNYEIKGKKHREVSRKPKREKFETLHEENLNEGTKESILGNNCTEDSFPIIIKGKKEDAVCQRHFKILQDIDEGTLIALNCAPSDEDLERKDS